MVIKKILAHLDKKADQSGLAGCQNAGLHCKQARLRKPIIQTIGCYEISSTMSLIFSLLGWQILALSVVPRKQC